MPQGKSEFADKSSEENKLGRGPLAGRRVIPIHLLSQDESADSCSGAEAFALMVLGDSMAPEFMEGEIIVIEPEGLAVDGSYVLAFIGDEWIFRQLKGSAGSWALHPVNAAYPTLSLPDFSAVRGVIIQKSKPGRRRASKLYVL